MMSRSRVDRTPTSADILRSRKFRKMRPFTRAVLQDDMEHARILYLMNINGVRNFMLEVGKVSSKRPSLIRCTARVGSIVCCTTLQKNGAEWILPFDGNTFFTRTGWEALRQTVLQQGSASRKYFAVPMARVVDNKHLLNADFMPEATVCPGTAAGGKKRLSLCTYLPVAVILQAGGASAGLPCDGAGTLQRDITLWASV